MNKYGISEAKSKVGFKTHAVPSSAVTTGRRSFRALAIRSAVFVSAFSLMFSAFAPASIAQDKTKSSGGYDAFLHSPSSTDSSDTFVWKVTGKKPGAGKEISHVVLSGCWEKGDIKKVTKSKGKLEIKNNGQIKLDNLSDKSLPLTITVKFKKSYYADGSANIFVKTGGGPSAGYDFDVDGPNCDGEVEGCDTENSQNNPDCPPDCDKDPQAEGCTEPDPCERDPKAEGCGPTPEPCGTELVKNGGFESPSIVHAAGWNIVPSGTAGLEWEVEWVAPNGSAPATANAELHAGVNGWLPQAGSQYTELDSDYDGPGGSLNGEPASVKISQTLTTVIGAKYDIEFYTSPRPGKGEDDNKIKFYWGGVEKDEIVEDGSANGNTVWTKHTYSLTATSTSTVIAFADAGNPESHGSFLDSVSVKEECPPEEPEITLHFIKVLCEDFSKVQGNQNAHDRDDTGGKFVEFSNYTGDGTNHSFNPLVNKPISPSEVPAGCVRSHVPWEFTISTAVKNDYKDHDGEIMVVGPTATAVYSVALSSLPQEFQDGIREKNGHQFWVSEVLQTGYGFAALRCYNDALNGDNMEFINIGQENPENIYCIAYNVPDELPEPCEPGKGWASAVVSNSQGKRKNGSNVLEERSDPNLATGPADWVPGTGSNFYSLGFGGSIVVSFSGYVIDVDGPDLSIHEATNGTYPLETASVEVSQDGATWYLAGTADNTPGDKVTYLDFGHTGLSWIKYVKVTDTSNAALFEATADGFDLDAVDATYEDCEPPSELICEQYENEVSIVDQVLSFLRVINEEKPKSCLISGYKFNSQEQGLANWEIFIDENDDGIWDGGEYKTTTNQEGYFEFSNLPAGKYKICELNQVGWTQTYPNTEDGCHDVTLVWDAITGLNFVNEQDDRGGNPGGGGSRSSGSSSTGQVLGDSTGLPFQQPQVLGELTELPRTGTPLSLAFSFIAILGIIILPRLSIMKS
ncbi:MAG TPA: hypothetical protein PKD79_02270 [Candidatus Doudnabacteria bacterium]|nr:hypothetical protein [Candidatus Doudnabacteria bacterium]